MTGAAACILSAVLAANQAAALPAASVPYLVSQVPVPLRFARSRPIAPPPPPEPVIEIRPEPELEMIQPEPPVLPNPADNPPKVESVPPRPQVESAPVADQIGAAELLPDIFAPPGGVRVEQLLPYFLPPPAQSSRATYEQE